MIQTFLRPTLSDNDDVIPTKSFKGDFWRKVYSKKFCNQLACPVAADLTTLYYFLWGYLKDKIYVNKSRTN